MFADDDFTICLQCQAYKKGSRNQHAKCMSRLGPLDNQIKYPIVQAHGITSRPQRTTGRVQLLHKTTAQEDDLCLLSHIVQPGWPSYTHEMAAEIQSHLSFHEEIAIQEGILLKGAGMII